MSIKKEMQDAINDQINAEMYSAYLYLSMSSWFESEDLPGIANWMRCQYLEEIMHAMKLFNYLNARGGRAVLKQIDEPKSEWKTYKEAVEEVVAHEEYISNRINKLVTLSRKIEDYATESLMMWYVDEQVEEEDEANNLLSKLRMLKEDSNGLLRFDSELASRSVADTIVPVILGKPAN